jgi:hypothetical protein
LSSDPNERRGLPTRREAVRREAQRRQAREAYAEQVSAETGVEVDPDEDIELADVDGQQRFRIREERRTEIQRKQAAESIDEEIADRDISTADIRQTDDGFELRQSVQRELAAENLSEEVGQPISPSDLAETSDGFELRRSVQRELAAENLSEEVGQPISPSDLEETSDGFQLGDRAQRKLAAEEINEQISSRPIGPDALTRTDEGFELRSGVRREIALDEITSDPDISRSDIKSLEQTDDGWEAEFTEAAKEERIVDQIAEESDELSESDIAGVDYVDADTRIEQLERRWEDGEISAGTFDERLETLRERDEVPVPELTEEARSEQAIEEIANSGVLDEDDIEQIRSVSPEARLDEIQEQWESGDLGTGQLREQLRSLDERDQDVLVPELTPGGQAKQIEEQLLNRDGIDSDDLDAVVAVDDETDVRELWQEGEIETDQLRTLLGEVRDSEDAVVRPVFDEGYRSEQAIDQIVQDDTIARDDIQNIDFARPDERIEALQEQWEEGQLSGEEFHERRGELQEQERSIPVPEFTPEYRAERVEEQLLNRDDISPEDLQAVSVLEDRADVVELYEETDLSEQRVGQLIGEVKNSDEPLIEAAFSGEYRAERVEEQLLADDAIDRDDLTDVAVLEDERDVRDFLDSANVTDDREEELLQQVQETDRPIIETAFSQEYYREQAGEDVAAEFGEDFDPGDFRFRQGEDGIIPELNQEGRQQRRQSIREDAAAEFGDDIDVDDIVLDERTEDGETMLVPELTRDARSEVIRERVADESDLIREDDVSVDYITDLDPRLRRDEYVDVDIDRDAVRSRAEFRARNQAADELDVDYEDVQIVDGQIGLTEDARRERVAAQFDEQFEDVSISPGDLDTEQSIEGLPVDSSLPSRVEDRIAEQVGRDTELQLNTETVQEIAYRNLDEDVQDVVDPESIQIDAETNQAIGFDADARENLSAEFGLDLNADSIETPVDEQNVVERDESPMVLDDPNRPAQAPAGNVVNPEYYLRDNSDVADADLVAETDLTEDEVSDIRSSFATNISEELGRDIGPDDIVLTLNNENRDVDGTNLDVTAELAPETQQAIVREDLAEQFDRQTDRNVTEDDVTLLPQPTDGNYGGRVDLDIRREILKNDASSQFSRELPVDVDPDDVETSISEDGLVAGLNPDVERDVIFSQIQQETDVDLDRDAVDISQTETGEISITPGESVDPEVVSDAVDTLSTDPALREFDGDIAESEDTYIDPSELPDPGEFGRGSRAVGDETFTNPQKDAVELSDIDDWIQGGIDMSARTASATINEIIRPTADFIGASIERQGVPLLNQSVQTETQQEITDPTTLPGNALSGLVGGTLSAPTIALQAPSVAQTIGELSIDATQSTIDATGEDGASGLVDSAAAAGDAAAGYTQSIIEQAVEQPFWTAGTLIGTGGTMSLARRASPRAGRLSEWAIQPEAELATGLAQRTIGRSRIGQQAIDAVPGSRLAPEEISLGIAAGIGERGLRAARLSRDALRGDVSIPTEVSLSPRQASRVEAIAPRTQLSEQIDLRETQTVTPEGDVRATEAAIEQFRSEQAAPRPPNVEESAGGVLDTLYGRQLSERAEGVDEQVGLPVDAGRVATGTESGASAQMSGELPLFSDIQSAGDTRAFVRGEERVGERILPEQVAERTRSLVEDERGQAQLIGRQRPDTTEQRPIWQDFDEVRRQRRQEQLDETRSLQADIDLSRRPVDDTLGRDAVERPTVSTEQPGLDLGRPRATTGDSRTTEPPVTAEDLYRDLREMSDEPTRRVEQVSQREQFLTDRDTIPDPTAPAVEQDLDELQERRIDAEAPFVERGDTRDRMVEEMRIDTGTRSAVDDVTDVLTNERLDPLSGIRPDAVPDVGLSDRADTGLRPGLDGRMDQGVRVRGRERTDTRAIQTTDLQTRTDQINLTMNPDIQDRIDNREIRFDPRYQERFRFRDPKQSDAAVDTPGEFEGDEEIWRNPIERLADAGGGSPFESFVEGTDEFENTARDEPGWL